MKNNVYKLVLVLFSLLTTFEVIVYLISSSSFIGLLYLLINFVILFMLFLVSTSVKKTNVRKRILFNIIIVAFGFMASFYVSSKTIVFGYTEISENYFNKILISSKILKSIIYSFILFISYLEFDRIRNKWNFIKKLVFFGKILYNNYEEWGYEEIQEIFRKE